MYVWQYYCGGKGKKVEIYNIPDAFSLPLRLKILSCLLCDSKSFTELREITKATDGNISVQLSKSEGWGYLISEKKLVGKKTNSTYRITDYGIKQFEEYINLLEDILRKASFN